MLHFWGTRRRRGCVSTKHGFLGRLEALRGIAALWVAVGHSTIWLPFSAENNIWAKSLMDVQDIQATIARALILIANGAAAVDIFFVLSGFVLAKSLKSITPSARNYLGYAIKPIFRIFPALLFSIVLILIYRAILSVGYTHANAAAIWFSWWHNDRLGFSEVVQNFLLMSYSLNSNAWTFV